MTKKVYLEMCEALQQEPDPYKMPIDFIDFPLAIQELFLIVDLLPDMWDGMSGAYMGKDMSLIPYLFEVYEIEDVKLSIFIITQIVQEKSKIYNNKLKQKANAAKRKK